MTVVLLYHDVAPKREFDSHGRSGPHADIYKLESAQFEAHLDAVERTGKSVGLLRPGRSTPDVAFSFDDGGRSSLATAEALERRGWRGHFFIITEAIGSAGFLGADEVRELDRRGHVIGSHSHSHPEAMARLDDEAIDSEWVRSRASLSALLGRAPEQAAVPGGDVSEAVIRSAASAGYTVLMTSDPVERIEHDGQLSVVGRFPIWGSTRPRTAASYASRRIDARTRLVLSWKAKRLAKRLTPRAYERLRRMRTGG
jgi:peptidoglycan/xylan/chitin deacetylase (PgdA/CDA1 family)